MAIGSRMMAYFFLGILITLLLVTGFEWLSVYHPKRKIETTPETVGLEYQDEFFFTEDDKKLHGWWLPHPEASAILLYCHGNAGNIGDRIHIIKSMHAMGFTVFAFDYRGYGQSRGVPHERGTDKDVRAAFEVVRVKNKENFPVIIYGRSMGGAVAAQLAVKEPVDGVILESTFTSIPDIGRHIYPFMPRFITRIQYNTLRKLETISSPVLVAHSQADGLIPFWMGEKLRDAAGADWADLNGTHSENPFEVTHGYSEKVKEFVSKCALNRSTPNH